MDEVVNLREELARLREPWSPRVVAELNGQEVKVARFEGEFLWHSHPREDELFWVLSGRLRMHLPDRTLDLGPGELLVVPRGTPHKPEALEPVECVLFEPVGTRRTGEALPPRAVEPHDPNPSDSRPPAPGG